MLGLCLDVRRRSVGGGVQSWQSWAGSLCWLSCFRITIMGSIGWEQWREQWSEHILLVQTMANTHIGPHLTTVPALVKPHCHQQSRRHFTITTVSHEANASSSLVFYSILIWIWYWAWFEFSDQFIVNQSRFSQRWGFNGWVKHINNKK